MIGVRLAGMNLSPDYLGRREMELIISHRAGWIDRALRLKACR
jgi:hypothetical protein